VRWSAVLRMGHPVGSFEQRYNLLLGWIVNGFMRERARIETVVQLMWNDATE
jgi:hypothetical protein